MAQMGASGACWAWRFLGKQQGEGEKVKENKKRRHKSLSLNTNKPRVFMKRRKKPKVTKMQYSVTAWEKENYKCQPVLN